MHPSKHPSSLALRLRVCLLIILPVPSLLIGSSLHADAATNRTVITPGDRRLQDYFRAETRALESNCLAGVNSLDDWNRERAGYREQLAEMLGLSPMPPRSELRPVVTGRLEQADFTVEKLHFQSMPGLYVTANLYLPRGVTGALPAILYLCGHAGVRTNGMSLGNKTAYRHHGIWFARNGYACLVLDTIQLGELEGLHHGTYREGMWWWNSRGYTPAGVEAWNCIRALDYLQSRPEVDGSRLGVTGRSGGGAYSWWVAALDDRIRAACPVAGITDLHNHVVDGTVKGHCDCMFFVNTHQWDYAQVAALLAPRPLLICNSDKDPIFPLEGVIRVHEKVRHIYRLHKAEDRLGLLITDGPHLDTQDLQLPVFRWFNRFLRNEDPLIAMPAEKLLTPGELRVFQELPHDQRTTRVHESFVPAVTWPPPNESAEWGRQREAMTNGLATRVFKGWPVNPPALNLRRSVPVKAGGLQLTSYQFTSQEHVQLGLHVVTPARGKPERVLVRVLSEDEIPAWVTAMRSRFPRSVEAEAAVLNEVSPVPRSIAPDVASGYLGAGDRPDRLARAFLLVRGNGADLWNPTPSESVQIRRRFMLLGQTLEGMRVWDIRRGLRALRTIDLLQRLPWELQGRGFAGANALYASLYEDGISLVRLEDLPATHAVGPDYLNVLRVLDIPQTLSLAAERRPWILEGAGSRPSLDHVRSLVPLLGWEPGRLQVRAAR